MNITPTLCRLQPSKRFLMLPFQLLCCCLLSLFLQGCAQAEHANTPSATGNEAQQTAVNQVENTGQTESAGLERAIFAGGCFWCMEPPFDKLKGVVATISGYIGGLETEPGYKAVASGKTGHTEAVEITYDPKQISYEALLDVYWRQIQPTEANRQFCDTGRQYRPEIFYVSQAQRRAAKQSKAELERSGRFEQPIVVPVTKATTFWPAEDYHQDYYLKNPIRYKYYRWGCGRDQYLDSIWGKGNH